MALWARDLIFQGNHVLLILIHTQRNGINAELRNPVGMLAIVISPVLRLFHVGHNMIGIEFLIDFISSTSKESPEAPGAAEIESCRMRCRSYVHRLEETFISVK